MSQQLVNMEKLLTLMEGDVELIREVFEVFAEEVPQRRDKFESALSDGDMVALMQLAHALKGSSGTLQAEPLRDVSRELEHAAREGRETAARELVPNLLSLLDRTAAAMREEKRRLA